MLLTIFATILTDQVKWTSDIIPEQEHGAVLEKGIIFNLVTKILLAEKFFNVDFLVPFSKFELDLRAELGAYIEKLGKLWTSPSWQCHVEYGGWVQSMSLVFEEMSRASQREKSNLTAIYGGGRTINHDGFRNSSSASRLSTWVSLLECLEHCSLFSTVGKFQKGGKCHNLVQIV